jgi:drug/metabolite transporter (DMT)-like permease
MTITVFFAVLGAARLHATWNACIKTGTNKQTSLLIMTVWQGALGALLVSGRPLPGADVWPWLLASGFVHMFYQLFLAYAYEQGDLSRVYPLARGTAPMMVLAVSVVALPDVVSAMEYIGILIIGSGIAFMAWGALRSGESRRLIPYAFGAACATAAYTLIDGVGARIGGDAVTYVGWLLLLAAFFYLPAIVGLKGWGVARAGRRDWMMGGVTGSASLGAYAIAVWAMSVAPIAVVAALRETSILFAMLIGWLVFKDRMDGLKIFAGLLIVGGVVLTRL